MMKGLAAASALALLAFATASALAQTEQTTTTSETPAKSGEPAAAPTPVDISANEMEILDKDKKAIFRGAVDATRGTTNLKSDELTVTYAEIKKPDGTTKTDATALDARGNVTITTPRETITGDWAKYNPQTEMLVVGGNVKLVQGKTVLTGNELQSDLKANKTQMTGGRVKGSFLPQ
jgi:lipopolysaccharide export system protein LptA